MAKAGRPAGSKNKPKTNLQVVDGGKSKPAGVGHNGDDADKALHFVHLRDYEKALAEKKKADADFKNITKRIKAEGGSVDAIKLTIQLRGQEGEKAFKETMEQMLRVARWNGLPIGTQTSLFDEDRRPIEERALNEGKTAGMRGENPSVPNVYPPDSPAGKAWMEGWHEGQKAIFNIQRPATSQLLRPEADDEDDDALDAGLGGDAGASAEGDDGAGDDAADDALGDEQEGGKGDDWNEDVRPRHLRDKEAGAEEAF
jgi:uncharacterized protein (UPF0335 family)